MHSSDPRTRQTPQTTNALLGEASTGNLSTTVVLGRFINYLRGNKLVLRAVSALDTEYHEGLT